MRITYLFTGLVLLATATSCLKDQCEATRTFIAYEPVWASSEELRTLTTEAPRALEDPGKIYVLGDWLFVNERWEGVHIFDNSDPANPQPLTFFRIPGNVDIAIRNGMLYADNGPDLVTLDLSDPASPQLVDRREGVFHNGADWGNQGFLLYYEATSRTVEVDCSENGSGSDSWVEESTVFLPNSFSAGDAAQSLNAAVRTGTGTGGSLARFTIMDSHLYAIDDVRLFVFDLNSPASPQQAATVDVGWGIETVFPVAPHLFIGANDGMYIYDASNPLQPVQLALFEHAQACDPVFVDGNIAYVTLRDGTECLGFVNQLDVVDVSSLTHPQLLQSYPMFNPIGISVADDHLYLCDNQEGLKVFDVSAWQNIGQGTESRVADFTAPDVITLPDEDLAIVVGPSGIQQFDIQDPTQPRRLSTIPVQ